jgi:hypothetical protein
MKDEELNLEEIEVSHTLGGEVEASLFFFQQNKNEESRGGNNVSSPVVCYNG